MVNYRVPLFPLQYFCVCAIFESWSPLVYLLSLAFINTKRKPGSSWKKPPPAFVESISEPPPSNPKPPSADFSGRPGPAAGTARSTPAAASCGTTGRGPGRSPPCQPLNGGTEGRRDGQGLDQVLGWVQRRRTVDGCEIQFAPHKIPNGMSRCPNVNTNKGFPWFQSCAGFRPSTVPLQCFDKLNQNSVSFCFFLCFFLFCFFWGRGCSMVAILLQPMCIGIHQFHPQLLSCFPKKGAFTAGQQSKRSRLGLSWSNG